MIRIDDIARAVFGWIYACGIFSVLPTEWDNTIKLGILTIAFIPGWMLYREGKTWGTKVFGDD